MSADPFAADPSATMSNALARRSFSVTEYNRMAEVGILKEDDRVELIEGAIIKMSPIGSRHAACVNRFHTLLNRIARQDFIISVQNPIVVDDYSEPEPDISVLRYRSDFYSNELPRAQDVLGAVEVADPTVYLDRNVKFPLYARTGIPIAILVNLPDELVEIHSEASESQYRTITTFRRGESFTLPFLPEIQITVDQILG
jgi:Uma2 family endonuclease